MTQDKKLDRKNFLTSAAAALAAVSLGACSSDEGDGGGTGGGTGGSATGGTAGGGTGGMPGGSGGTAGGGAGGMSGGSGGSGGGQSVYTCTADTNMASNGNNHSHPLTIPGSDIERGFQEAPYLLEDGGTGHTHTLELAAYEWAYLAGGVGIDAPSSTDAGHFHTVFVDCMMD
jgi:hypothetical protein